jgi:hypothetical protein
MHTRQARFQGSSLFALVASKARMRSVLLMLAKVKGHTNVIYRTGADREELGTCIWRLNEAKNFAPFKEDFKQNHL